MKKYIGFFFLLLFVSCYPSYVEEAEVVGTSEPKFNSMIDWTLVDTVVDIDYFISRIESSENIESKHIGFTGEKSIIYSYYEKLLEIASDSLWIELSYSKSAVMRYYAYQALLSKGNIRFLSVRNRLIKDTSCVCFHTFDMINCLTLGSRIKSLFSAYSNYPEIYVEYYKGLNNEKESISWDEVLAIKDSDFKKILQKELRIGGFSVDECNEFMQEELKIKKFNILDSKYSKESSVFCISSTK